MPLIRHKLHRWVALSPSPPLPPPASLHPILIPWYVSTRKDSNPPASAPADLILIHSHQTAQSQRNVDSLPPEGSSRTLAPPPSLILIPALIRASVPIHLKVIPLLSLMWFFGTRLEILPRVACRTFRIGHLWQILILTSIPISWP